MKTALLINQVSSDVDVNLSGIMDLSIEACDAGAQLVVLPEAALTGLINDDNPAHDLPLGQLISGPVTNILSALCCKRRVWLAIGLLEREGNQLFDSAILIAPDGNIRFKYRRMQPQWHG